MGGLGVIVVEALQASGYVCGRLVRFPLGLLKRYDLWMWCKQKA